LTGPTHGVINGAPNFTRGVIYGTSSLTHVAMNTATGFTRVIVQHLVSLMVASNDHLGSRNVS